MPLGNPGFASAAAMELKGDIESQASSFTRTLAQKGGEVPIPYQHNQREPIGRGRVIETAKGFASRRRT